jgi:hypothetical protein
MTIALTALLRGGDWFIPTLLQDKDGAVDDMIERYHTRSLASICCQNAAERVNRGSGTIIYNYEPLPAPKINQLVIPTGSTRWSYCLLLADDYIKDLIYTVSENGTVPMNLIFGTPVDGVEAPDHIISLTVNILPPKRVSPETLDSSVMNLWIIPVVDERYWLQFEHSGTLSESLEVPEVVYPDPPEPARPFTPNELVDHIGTLSGLPFLNVGVNSRYQLLPTCASENDNENLPILMDSIFQHYGQRLVVDIGCWNGTNYSPVDVDSPSAGSTRYAVIDGTNSQVVLENNYFGYLGLQTCVWYGGATGVDANPSVTTAAASGVIFVGRPNLVAGGTSTSFPSAGPYASVPYSVDVRSTEDTYSRETAFSIHETAYVASTANAIWRTQFDDTTDEESPEWWKGASLDRQIARDYYYQFLHQFDFTFAGVQPWQQGYFDDFMVYRQTYNPLTKEYDAYTRVCSRQPNLTGEWVTGGDGGGGGSTVWAVNIGSLPPATHPLTGARTGVAGLFTKDGEDLETSDRRRSFIRRDGAGTIADGTLIQLGRVSGKWTIIWADCAAHADLKGLEAEP